MSATVYNSPSYLRSLYCRAHSHNNPELNHQPLFRLLRQKAEIRDPQNQEPLSETCLEIHEHSRETCCRPSEKLEGKGLVRTDRCFWHLRVGYPTLLVWVSGAKGKHPMFAIELCPSPY